MLSLIALHRALKSFAVLQLYAYVDVSSPLRLADYIYPNTYTARTLKEKRIGPSNSSSDHINVRLLKC